MSGSDLCPCGSGRPYADCCGPALAGERLPETAEALMRSRFTAFARGDAAYLLASWHPQTRPTTLNLADQPVWERLEIIRTQAGAAGDRHGRVEFAAQYRTEEGPGCLREVSRFSLEQGRWFYVDGLQPAQGKPSRNTPCPCGSGRKYKHCCGR